MVTHNQPRIVQDSEANVTPVVESGSGSPAARGDQYVGMSESELIDPRIPRAANTPKLDVPGLSAPPVEPKQPSIVVLRASTRVVKLASPLALLIGVLVGLLVSWFAGVL